MRGKIDACGIPVKTHYTTKFTFWGTYEMCRKYGIRINLVLSKSPNRTNVFPAHGGKRLAEANKKRAKKMKKD
jgi:hypothetical protein